MLTVLAGVRRLPGLTAWVARPVSDVLRERAHSVGRIEDALARRLWSRLTL